ncbi:MAG: hypothetical protein ACI8PZ_006576, partial [Myxococcota bacterium]
PDVDAARPARCPSCGKPSRCDGRLQLEGNGVRWREVIVPAQRGGFAVVKSWVRRYRCLNCGAAPSVQPPGVLPGHLYTLAAMLAVWLRLAAFPVGAGQTEREVCAHRGADRPGEVRWRSPRRWAGLATSWWPSHVGGRDISRLLMKLVCEARSTEVAALTRRATAGHVMWGAAR